MPSITIENRNELIALVVGMFNAAPGANNLGSLAAMLTSGKQLVDIVNFMTTTPEYSQIYPSTLGTDDFVAHLATNLLGNEAGTAATHWATDWAKAQLMAGNDRASVITAAVQALLASTNTDFANAKAMLNNKVNVASYFSVSKVMSYKSLTDLQSVIEGITSDPASVIAHKAALDRMTAYEPSHSYGFTSQDYLDAAAAGNNALNSKAMWCQFPGNTYVVEDNSASSTYQNGTDTIVKLTGLVDLDTAALTTVNGAAASITLT